MIHPAALFPSPLPTTSMANFNTAEFQYQIQSYQNANLLLKQQELQQQQQQQQQQ